MFIAHMPAGYLLARFHARRGAHLETPGLMLAGMLGGAFPDIDLVYAVLVDGGRLHHHLYWTHLPMCWLAGQAAIAVLLRLSGHAPGDAGRNLFAVFMLGIWSHLLLDSVAGDIWWLWPWVDTPFSLVHIAPRYSPWWLNYLLHWSALLEIAIVGLAVCTERTWPVLLRWRWRAA